MICPKSEGKCTFWEWAEPDEIEELKSEILGLKKEMKEVKKNQASVKVVLVVFIMMYVIGLLK